MSDAHELPLADTSDMIGLHQVFRDALGAAPTLVAGVAPGDQARADFVANHYVNVLSLLHAHHDGEDELMTPRLLQRCPDQTETISRIASQHASVVDAIAAAEASLAAWQADASQPNRDRAADRLAHLRTDLTPHLDEEEREILPIASSCINVAEWGQLPEHGLKSFTGDKPWLIIGLIQDQMTAEQVAGMQAHMPPPVVDFWLNVGQQLYRDHQAELHDR